MASVGNTLRQARERQGLSLEAIAEQTRIKAQYLQALEADDFESLPGRFFARSFTNQYANRLGVNTPELQAALQLRLGGLQSFQTEMLESITPSSPIEQFTVDPLPEGTASAMNARKLTASLVMLFAVITACGAVFWLWQRSQLKISSANTLPTETAVPAPAEVTRQLLQPPTAALPETVSPPAAQPTKSDAKVDSPVTLPQTVSTMATAPPVAAAREEVGSGPIRLSITARENVWIRITVDGKVAVERVLALGETATATGSSAARILIGNAGGLSIQFNGSDIGAVGPRGQVRTVEFTPGAFKVIEPQKKPVAAASPVA